MKKVSKSVISLVLVLAMALSVNLPATNVKAKGSRDSRAKHYSYDGVEVADSFKKQKMTDLYDQFVIPSSMSKLNVEKSTDTVNFSGKKAAFNAGKIQINKDFDFGTDSVGRFSFDAVRTTGNPVSVSFYLDDEAEPFVTAPILRKKIVEVNKDEEEYEDDEEVYPTQEAKGEVSTVVMAKNITGTHKLSISFNTSASEPAVEFRSVEFVKNSLPIVYFNIDENEGTVEEMNESENHSARCHGSMDINVPSGYVGEYANNVQSGSYEMEYMRGRGNSTWELSKKPYKIKLASKANLFGMGKNKHWVLIANAYDNSKVRNKLTYTLGERLNMPYTPKQVPVDVVMNGEYYGSYYLSEQIRVGENRVDIPDLTDTNTKLSDEEITGGYLLAVDTDNPTEDSIKTERQLGFKLDSPAFEDYTNTQTTFDEVKGYITDYLNRIEEALYSEDGKNSKGEHYSELLDVDSVANYYLFQEVSKNNDGFATGSTYFYKDRNAKLCYGPLWDFDYVAWNGSENINSEGDAVGFDHRKEYWLGQLMLNEDFRNKVYARYDVMKVELLDMVADGGYIDQLYSSLCDSMYYDIEKWSFYDHGFIEEDSESEDEYVFSFVKERDRLKDWIRSRIKWIDENKSEWKTKTCHIKFSVDGQEVYSTDVAEDDKIYAPKEDPKKDGKVFLGWFMIDEEGDEAGFLNGTVAEKDLDIYAKFIDKKDIVNPTDLIMRDNDVYVKLSDESYSVTYMLLPTNITFVTANITSLDENVAKIDQYGTVELKGEGVTTIKVSTTNGISKSFKLHVVPEDYDVEYQGIDYLDDSITMKPGEIRPLNYKVIPENACKQEEVNAYTSGNKEIVSVDDEGFLTAVGKGTTFVLAKSKAGTKLISVTVKDSDPVKPTESKDDLTLFGEFLKANAGIKYYSVIMRSGAKPLLLTSSAVKKNKYSKNASVYTISGGKVIKVGTVKAKKGYIKYKNGKIVAKLGKNKIAYYKVKNACLTGQKYVKKKKKYYKYTLNCTKFVKKKKISKKKGKKYLKAKGAKSIVFAAK